MSKTTVFRVSDCSCGVKIKTTKKKIHTKKKQANKKKKITTDKLTTENEEKCIYQAEELIKATEYCVAKIQK